jgi:hypothetical protein
MNDNAEKVRVRAPDTSGMPNESRDSKRKDPKEAPTAPKPSDAPPRDTRESPAPNPDAGEATTPKTSTVAEPEPDTSRSSAANRDVDGPRKAGTTPRPPDKPVEG